MRIKTFKIIKYGPLQEKGPFTLGFFNLFWGKNETGKTLTIDALVKMLFGKNLKTFKKIQRVQEMPEGYIDLEIKKNKTVKIPEAGRLPDLVKITPSEGRNIFIIRDSDLGIDQELEFYTNITDRLTGLKTRRIEKLIEVIVDKAKITPTDFRFRNQKGENLKERLEQGKALLKEIQTLKQEFENQDFQKIENDLNLYQQQLEKIEARKQALELAEKRERFEQASKALEGLKDILNKLQTLKNYNESDFQKWRDLERDIIRYQRERLNLLERLKQEERSLNDLIQKDRIPEPTKKTKLSTFYKNVAIFGSLTALSLLGFLITSFTYLIIPVLVFGLTSIYFAFLQSLTLKEAKKEFEKRINQLQERINGLKSQISEKEKSVAQAQSEIQEIQKRCNLVSLETYEQKINLRKELKEQINKKTTVLTHMFGSSENEIEVWQKKVDFLSKYKDKSLGIKFSEAEVESLETEKTRLQEKIKNLKNKAAILKEKLSEIGRKANTILKPEKPLLSETSMDLTYGIEKQLKNFVEASEHQRRNAIEALKILEEISKEEKKKIKELFGKNSLISDYFSKITKGRYQQVFFDQENSVIQVQNSNGDLLSAERLSGGAFDQLYMCIRLALGKKLLEGERGFFILDDPFVKADPDRLKDLLGLLKKISELGWQVIYFSCKGEVKAFLEKEIKKGTIREFLFE